MKCVVYCCVSTGRQREAGTIESQRELLIQTARSNNWTVVSVEEDDGFSGTVPAWERPGMSRALRLIERREVDYLLMVPQPHLAHRGSLRARDRAEGAEGAP